jgi:hypothetical protein
MKEQKHDTNAKEKQTNINTTSTRKIVKHVLQFVIGVFFVPPLFITAFTVTTGGSYVQNTEVEIISVDKKPINTWVTLGLGDYYPSKVKVLKHPTSKNMDLLLLTKDQLKYTQKGGRMIIKVVPHQPSTWYDFFKCFYNTYDYEATTVFGFTDSKGKFKKV